MWQKAKVTHDSGGVYHETRIPIGTILWVEAEPPRRYETLQYHLNGYRTNYGTETTRLVIGAQWIELLGEFQEEVKLIPMPAEWRIAPMGDSTH